ncbi:hypothetical protein [Streptomyces sp.]|uniref:hypothetical protein n=1 Tax=Streptomyces sp. TaxID=1931 RepID=UPI002D7757F8|nr:hypothetical protein [Streptomyces sp.]HET6355994.1 hypothetical protein [Streptomyces sp.]
MSYPTLFTTSGLKTFAEAVDTERQAQLAKWGDQKHPDGTGAEYYVGMADQARDDVEHAAESLSGPRWALILLEEVYEALAESDPAKLRAELIQAAAVIAAWVSDLDRRPAPEDDRPTGPSASPTAVLLASRCDACRHTLNRHANYAGCTVPLCVCGRFQPPAEGSDQ